MKILKMLNVKIFGILFIKLVVYSLRIVLKIVNDMVGNFNLFLLMLDFIDLLKYS